MTTPFRRRSAIEPPGDWVGFRHSLANVVRRVERGEAVAAIVVCSFCKTELDVPRPVHSPRCDRVATVEQRSPRAAKAPFAETKWEGDRS